MNRGFGEGEGPCGTLTVIYEEIKGGKNRHMNRNTDFRIKPRILRVNIGRASAVIFFKDSDKFTVKIGIILRKGKLSFNWHPAPNDISFQDSISAEYQYELKILQFQPWKAGKRKKKKSDLVINPEQTKPMLICSPWADENPKKQDRD